VKKGEGDSIPDRSHVPTACDSGFADAGAEEAIASCNDYAFLDCLRHAE
jgi:hypothetical protein